MIDWIKRKLMAVLGLCMIALTLWMGDVFKALDVQDRNFSEKAYCDRVKWELHRDWNEDIDCE